MSNTQKTYPTNVIKVSKNSSEFLKNLAYDVACKLFFDSQILLIYGKNERLIEKLSKYITDLFLEYKIEDTSLFETSFSFEFNGKKKLFHCLDLRNLEENEALLQITKLKSRSNFDITLILKPIKSLLYLLPTTDLMKINVTQNDKIVLSPKILVVLNDISRRRNGQKILLKPSVPKKKKQKSSRKRKINFPEDELYLRKRKYINITNHALLRARQTETISRDIRSDEKKLEAFLIDTLRGSTKAKLSKDQLVYLSKKHGRKIKKSYYVHNSKHNLLYVIHRSKSRNDHVLTVIGERINIPMPLKNEDEKES